MRRKPLPQFKYALGLARPCAHAAGTEPKRPEGSA